VWDYCEVNPIVATSGSWSQAIFWVALCLDETFATDNSERSIIRKLDARTPRSGFQSVITDPPYYYFVSYAEAGRLRAVWWWRASG
jgi:adenine-specific DNA methylase